MKVNLHINMKPMRNALKTYMEHTRRSLPEVLTKQAKMLCCGAKGVKGLYQEAVMEAPDTRREILGLPKALGWRIKRGKGGGRHSAMKEIRRRLKFVGRVQSTAWLQNKYGRVSPVDGVRPLYFVRKPRGRVREVLGGLFPYITLINSTPNAGQFAKRTGYADRAVRNRAADMNGYVERKLREAAQKAGLKK